MPSPTRAATDRFGYITSGPVGRAVIHLAWPVVLSEALHTLFHVVDIVWVGRLGAWATASISSSMFALWAVLSVANLVSVGLTAQVGRALGARDVRRAENATAQALLFALGVGCAVGFACFLLADRLFQAIGATPEVAQAGAGFLRIYGAGAPLPSLYPTSPPPRRAPGTTRPRRPTPPTAW